MTSSKKPKHFFSYIDVCKTNAIFTSETFGINFEYEICSYLSRCAFNVFNVYEKLAKIDKKACKKELKSFAKYLIDQNAFGNPALKMRCYGKAFWVLYKVYEKTVGRLLKGK